MTTIELTEISDKGVLFPFFINPEAIATVKRSTLPKEQYGKYKEGTYIVLTSGYPIVVKESMALVDKLIDQHRECVRQENWRAVQGYRRS